MVEQVLHLLGHRGRDEEHMSPPGARQSRDAEGEPERPGHAGAPIAADR